MEKAAFLLPHACLLADVRSLILEGFFFLDVV
jgi:hypothetical protein